MSSYIWGAKCKEPLHTEHNASIYPSALVRTETLTRQLTVHEKQYGKTTTSQQAGRGSRGSHRAPVQEGHGTARELWWLRHSILKQGETAATVSKHYQILSSTTPTKPQPSLFSLSYPHISQTSLQLLNSPAYEKIILAQRCPSIERETSRAQAGLTDTSHDRVSELRSKLGPQRNPEPWTEVTGG